jgi:hypothetical protein
VGAVDPDDVGHRAVFEGLADFGRVAVSGIRDD